MKVYVVRPAADAEITAAVEVVEFDDDMKLNEEPPTVVARGYLRLAMPVAPEPGAEVASSVNFYGMGVQP